MAKRRTKKQKQTIKRQPPIQVVPAIATLAKTTTKVGTAEITVADLFSYDIKYLNHDLIKTIIITLSIVILELIIWRFL